MSHLSMTINNLSHHRPKWMENFIFMEALMLFLIFLIVRETRLLVKTIKNM